MVKSAVRIELLYLSRKARKVPIETSLEQRNVYKTVILLQQLDVK